MSQEDYPFLYSVAFSVLQKLDQCDLEEFGGDSNEVEMLKDILTHLPSIVTSFRNAESESRSSDIYKSVFGLHELLNKQVHPSLKPSWSDLVNPLATLKGEFIYWKNIESERKLLLPPVSFPLPKSDDFKVDQHPPLAKLWHAKSIESERKLLSPVSFALPKSDDFKVDQLPPHLVPCVAYCALYPVDHRIVRETLVNQWMAEGFLGLQTAGTSSGGGDMEMELEERGDRNFMELLSMGVFKEPVFRFGGNQQALTVYSCKMHPNVHKKARDIIVDERFHLGAISSDPRVGEKTRTCIFFVPQIRYCFRYLDSHPEKLPELQILDVAGIEFEELPACFKKIHRLRYLALSRNTLLKRIDKIDWRSAQQLQTLAVDGCVQLEKFNLEHMTLLRHLYYTSKEPTLVPHTSTLRILQLSQCSELRALSLSNGASFESLRRLRIFECPRLVSLPDNIHLLPRLEELVIHNCLRLDLSEGRWLDSLPRLQHMELIGLPKMTELPAGLQSARALQYLMIADCMSLRSTDQVLLHLHSLQELYVYDCPALSMAPNVFQSLTALQSLDIRMCQKVTATSKDDLTPFISHIPHIIFDGQHFLTRNDDLSEENDAAVGPQMPSLGAQTDFYSLRQFPYFLLNMEKNNNSLEGMLTVKYKLKIPYRWAILALALRAVMNMRVLLRQTMFDCRLFPSDFEFEEDKLVQLWMARGLLLEPRERLANKRFDRLLANGYILHSRTDKLTGVSWYKINVEMVPTLLDRVKSKELYALIDGENTGVDTSTSWHHVSIASNSIDETVFETLEGLKELKSVLFIRDYGPSLKQIPSTFFKSLQLMHTLDLSGSHISELPSTIRNMTDLFFLDLSFTLIERIPESVKFLQKLQTMKLKGCMLLHTLPKGMKALVNLYHLDFDVLGQLSSMPKGLGSLTRLHTLSAFIVSEEDGCGFSELKDMNNLGGSLCISGLEHANHYNDAHKANMQAKTCLTKLHLQWPSNYESAKLLANLTLERLRPYYESLVELQISYYPDSVLAEWISDQKFMNLSSITLLQCENNELLPLERLPKLRHLTIFEMNRVTNIHTIHGSFVSICYEELETLVIDGMCNLKSWTGGIEEKDCPCLSEMRIRHCPKLLELPFLQYLNSLKYLEISYCKNFETLPPPTLPASLQTLMINHCPLLKKRCSVGGDDWEKIKHVENIWIDMKDIRSAHEDSDSVSSEEEDDLDYNDSD